MNIAIILYSGTGNTSSVAQRLQEKLAAAGHTVNVEQITVEGDVSPGKKDFQFTHVPSPDPYEALVFASPVQAFSLNPVMEVYLKQLPTLEGKKVALLVTKHLRFHWTGGTRAASTMKRLCQEKGAKVLGSEIVVWSGNKREENIQGAVEGLSRLF